MTRGTRERADAINDARATRANGERHMCARRRAGARRRRNFFHGPLHLQIDRWICDKLRVAPSAEPDTVTTFLKLHQFHGV